jgi:hypothetical protein
VQSPTLSAAISARWSPTCKPTDNMARSRNPAIVSSAGMSSSLRASIFAKARVDPSSQLIAGRSTSPTGLLRIVAHPPEPARPLIR